MASFVTLLRGKLALPSHVAACVLAIVAGTASGDLVHQYTFNNLTTGANGIIDSVGGAHGTLIDNTGIAGFAGGALDLTGNQAAGGGGLNSNQDFSLPTTVGAYVDLPNGIISAAAQSGAAQNNSAEFSIETWVNIQTNRNWARIADFGRSDMGENFSTGGANSNYFFLAPAGAPGGTVQLMASSHTGTAGDIFVGTGAPLVTNMWRHVVMTVNQNDDFSGGANGTLKMYLQGALIGSANIAAGLTLPFDDGFGGITAGNLDDINNWIGRAQWGDPLLDGLVDEFNIYDHSLSDAEVSANFAAGPIPAPLPRLQVNLGTGAVSFLNPSGSSVNLTGYSITSASGALDTVNNTSPGAGWTFVTETSAQITQNGSSNIAGLGSLSIGDAFVPTYLAPDLAFQFGLSGGPLAGGLIDYIGTSPIRSDFDADGDIDDTDWQTFLAGHGNTFVADLAVARYLQGDLNNDGDNDYFDFKLFKADFIALNGAAAFAALTGNVVPEPGSVLLLAGGLGLLVLVRRRKA